MNKGRERFHSRFFYASSLFCLSLSAKVKEEEEEEVKESRVSNPDQKKTFPLSFLFEESERWRRKTNFFRPRNDKGSLAAPLFAQGSVNEEERKNLLHEREEKDRRRRRRRRRAIAATIAWESIRSSSQERHTGGKCVAGERSVRGRFQLYGERRRGNFGFTLICLLSFPFPSGFLSCQPFPG